MQYQHATIRLPDQDEPGVARMFVRNAANDRNVSGVAAAGRCPSAGSLEAMALLSHFCLYVRSSGAPRPSNRAFIALLLVVTACSPVASASTTPSRPELGISAASSGVCQAIGALPDVSAAQRAFTNGAHDPLHRLAADPRLGRSMSARVLEKMEKVEADFSHEPDVAALRDDLAELHASANAALQTLGEDGPACAS